MLIEHFPELNKMSDQKVDVTVDVVGENCPKPLIEARKALKKMDTGQIMEIVGNHPASRKEIPMAANKLKHEVVDVSDDDQGNWHILIKKN